MRVNTTTWFSGIIALLFAFLAPSAHAEEKGKPVIPFKLSVAPGGPVYKGLPAIAEITITNPSPSLVDAENDAINDIAEIGDDARKALLQYYASSFPAFNVLSMNPPLGIEITNKDGKTIRPVCAPGRNAFGQPPGTRKEPQEWPRPSMASVRSSSLLVDLSPWFAGLEPGEYRMKVALYSEVTNPPWISDSVRIELRRVAKDHLDVLRQGVPAFREKGDRMTVIDWADKEMNVKLLRDKLPREMFSVLAVHAFLSEARKASDIGKIPLKGLDAVPANLKPLTSVWKYEVLLAKKEASAKRMGRDLALAHPQVLWLLYEAEDGEGFVSKFWKYHATK